MRLKIYCNRFTHFKDTLVCSVNCAYRTRCADFALLYDSNREQIDRQVDEYLTLRRDAAHVATAAAAIAISKTGRTANTTTSPLVKLTRELPFASGAGALVRLEVKQVMTETTYIWINKDDQAEVLDTKEVLRRAERGAKAKHIFRVAQEMELRYQLVPRKRIDKAKQAAQETQERAAARRSRLRAVQPDDLAVGLNARDDATTASALNAAAVSNVTKTANASRTRVVRRPRAAKIAG